MKLQIVLIFCLAISATLARDISRRIVNGEEADIADFPHALALFDSGRFFCGASVISRHWALTAGKLIKFVFFNGFQQFKLYDLKNICEVLNIQILNFR